jgi:hypothetical protein
MKKWFPLLFIALVSSLHAQQIPQQLWGAWTVTQILPANTISCWGDKEAKALLGTRIEYSANLFRWKTAEVKNPKATVKTYTAEQFRDEYSGGGANSSQVSFDQLGIHAHQVDQVTIEHPDADITGGTTQIPGDTVLLKSNSSIVFSVCNVYFEARKLPDNRH